MRWISIDEKPSWFNNAGHTGTYALQSGPQPTVRENFAATRERYTILTGVPSWGHEDQDIPPKLCVLFKGKPGGRILRALEKEFAAPDWLRIQVQENGSYRSEDVVEALDFMLPDAKSPSESIVVLLDWYSGHRTDEVAELVRRKGHVLLFHGGGTTAFSQVNDTHLHALVARMLITLENAWAHSQRTLAQRAGHHQTTPAPKRHVVMEIVQSMWLSIDHGRIAKKGYQQTGPEMPLEGPVDRADVYKDLRPVMDKIDPGSQPTSGQVGTSIRDRAVAFVNAEWEAGRLHSWADAHLLIEEHDDEDEPVEEGLEAFTYDPSDHSDSSGSADDDGGDGGDGGGGGGGAKGRDDDGDVHPDLDDPRGPPLYDLLWSPSSDGGDDDGGGGGGEPAAASSAPAPSQRALVPASGGAASSSAAPAPSQRGARGEVAIAATSLSAASSAAPAPCAVEDCLNIFQFRFIYIFHFFLLHY